MSDVEIRGDRWAMGIKRLWRSDWSRFLLISWRGEMEGSCMIKSMRVAAGGRVKRPRGFSGSSNVPEVIIVQVENRRALIVRSLDIIQAAI